ncbi:hypothetical protein C8R47DRAFT_617253 [Mycena vitilis]|nr:hypothetical protein C8R47DRAFT_617253 [Mycena vitilis]
MAYAAYGDQAFLDYAIQSWWFGQTYTLTPQQAAAGKTTIKNFTISSVCQGITMAGGTFASNVLDQTSMGSLANGNFLVLSALLAEATSDPLYRQAAIDSANFIKSHLLNSDYQVQDAISGSESEGCAANSLNESYNPGLVIEGLSILYSVTGDSATLALLRNIVNATIPNPGWQHPNGVLINGDFDLPRGLTALYSRKLTPDFQDDIGHYIAVQFNAVTDLATANGTNIYGKPWAGPANSTFDPFNQINALEALVSAMRLRNDSDASASTPTASPQPTDPGTTPLSSGSSRHSSNESVIIGSALGALSLTLIVVSGIWAIVRRRRRSKSNSMGVSRVNPFGIWYNFRRRGKRATDALGAAPAIPTGPRATKGDIVSASRRVRPPVAPARLPTPAQSSTAAQPPINLPTVELVRMLNERLQGQDWDEEEAPPDYPV